MAKVLLIQRERIFLSMYGHALVKANHQVFGTDDFETGRKILETASPAVVLCGFQQRMTNDDLAEIRALRRIRSNVPLVVLSHREEPALATEAILAGASMVLREQVSSDHLTDVVTRVCARAANGRYPLPEYPRPAPVFAAV